MWESNACHQNLVHEVMKKFPFALTEGQKSVFRDIEDSMEGIVPMQRLVQGDVGSGKTAIAILALTKIMKMDIRGAYGADRVLTAQHFKTFQQVFKGMPVKTTYLSGHTKSGGAEGNTGAAKRRQYPYFNRDACLDRRERGVFRIRPCHY